MSDFLNIYIPPRSKRVHRYGLYTSFTNVNDTLTCYTEQSTVENFNVITLLLASDAASGVTKIIKYIITSVMAKI